jgi:hypothetical protein
MNDVKYAVKFKYAAAILWAGEGHRPVEEKNRKLFDTRDQAALANQLQEHDYVLAELFRANHRSFAAIINYVRGRLA